MGIRFPLRGKRSARRVLPPKKAQYSDWLSELEDAWETIYSSCLLGQMEKLDPELSTGLWFSQNLTGCWHWVVERTHTVYQMLCFPWILTWFLHLFNKYIWSTYCGLVYLIGSGEETHTHIFLCQFLVHFKITIGPQWAFLIAAGPKGPMHTEAWIVSWSAPAVPAPLLKPGEILETGESAALSGLLVKDFLRRTVLGFLFLVSGSPLIVFRFLKRATLTSVPSFWFPWLSDELYFYDNISSCQVIHGQVVPSSLQFVFWWWFSLFFQLQCSHNILCSLPASFLLSFNKHPSVAGPRGVVISRNRKKKKKNQNNNTYRPWFRYLRIFRGIIRRGKSVGLW